MKDLKALIADIKTVDSSWFDVAQKRLDNLTKPPGSLGRLEEFARRLVAIFESLDFDISKKVIFTFASDHGVSEEGVSAYPKDVTWQMVYNFLRGGAGINVLARHAGAHIVVVDVGVDHDFRGIENLVHKKIMSGTKNFLKEPAMTRAEAEQSIQVGIEMVEKHVKLGYRLFGTGEMGIGNTTPSSAIAALLTKRSVEEVTGKGSGIDDRTFKRKVEVIERALSLHKPDPSDPIDVLAKIGGPEIGAIAGVVLGAAYFKMPVVIDGFISTAGALIAYQLNPAVRDYMFASHNSCERGHRAMLEMMGLNPILDLNLRLGEGTGAALAMLMIEAGAKILKEMATFDDAKVSKNIR